MESFIYKVRLVLLDKDIPEKPELMNYLKSELDGFYKARKETSNFKRTKQDFYILWYALNPLNLQMVKHFRLEIKKELQDIFYNMKNVPPAAHSNERGAENFIKLINNFHQKYKVQVRKTKLSESEKENLIKQQGNRCAISGAPIFLGDDIEVDHKNPLALGGEDTKDNLQIAHKDSNRRKGASRTDTKLQSNVVDRGDKGDKGDKGEKILSTNATSYELSPQESGTSSTDNSNAETI